VRNLYILYFTVLIVEGEAYEEEYYNFLLLISIGLGVIGVRGAPEIQPSDLPGCLPWKKYLNHPIPTTSVQIHIMWTIGELAIITLA